MEFKSGSNSKSEVVKEINCRNQDCSDLDIETTVPASQYLYIRFNGYLDVYSVFNISYSTYHMESKYNIFFFFVKKKKKLAF